MTTTKPQADVQAALDNMAQEYVFQIHGRGLSTSVGVQTRRLLHDAFVAGFKSATTHPTKPQENVTCGDAKQALNFIKSIQILNIFYKDKPSTEEQLRAAILTLERALAKQQPDAELRRGIPDEEVKKILKEHFNSPEFGENENAYNDYINEMEENKRIIADLLEALKDARLSMLDNGYNTSSAIIQKCSQAIARAEKKVGE